jgi:phage tail-like protein
MAGGRTQPNDALTAARFVLTVDGAEVAQFSDLIALSSGVDPSALTVGPGQKGAAARKLPGQRAYPTVTLKRGQSNDLGLFSWHGDALSRRAARKDAVLVMFDVQGRPVARYHLESAWPAKIVVSGEKVGASQVLFETVTVACDAIERVSP